MDIRTYMHENRMSARQLAEKAGMDPAVFCRLLKLMDQGKSDPKASTAKRIEQATRGKVSCLEILYPKEYEGMREVQIFATKPSYELVKMNDS